MSIVSLKFPELAIYRLQFLLLKMVRGYLRINIRQKILIPAGIELIMRKCWELRYRKE
jgi:hypothetical protein